MCNGVPTEVEAKIEFSQALITAVGSLFSADRLSCSNGSSASRTSNPSKTKSAPDIVRHVSPQWRTHENSIVLRLRQPWTRCGTSFFEELECFSPNPALESSNGFSIVADDQEDRCSSHLILNRGLRFECFQRIGARFAVQCDSQIIARSPSPCPGKLTVTGSLPTEVSQSFSYSLLYLGTGARTCPAGNSVFPLCKRDLIIQDTIKSGTAQWAEQSFSCDLLPPRSGFTIAHQKILIVDSCQVKMQDSARSTCFSTPDRCDTAFNT